MARIRAIEIHNFRGIKEFTWLPSPGLNCLIGPGDSGKSSILDAVDLCLGARRNIQFSDADFHRLDVETPINISVTLGELDKGLKNLDAYGMYLRGFDAQSGKIEDEPEKDAETVLTVRLTVVGDLEPSWSLVSRRAEKQEQTRNLSWGGVRAESRRNGVSDESRAVLGKAARTRKAGWFKSVTWMEEVARNTVGPDLADADAGFTALIEDIFAWASDGGE
jgi:hypothetical protein